MLEIKKRTSRRCRQPFAHYQKRIVVEIEPLADEDVISMRLERSRIRYRAPIDRIFRLLALWHARMLLAEKKSKPRRRSKLF